MLLGALTLLPAIIASVTPFLRITLVLHFLRQALGLQTTPSNQVLIGLALFLSILVMQPVARAGLGQGMGADGEGRDRHVGSRDAGYAAPPGLAVEICAREGHRVDAETVQRSSAANSRRPRLKVLIPAYVLSELKTGFQIGAVLFLPFLIIDIVVASVTLSIGMMQLPPVMISAPFKILLFVLVDGWTLVVGSLVRSF